MSFPATLAERMSADRDRLMRLDRFAEAITARLPDETEHVVAGALWAETDESETSRDQDHARLRVAKVWLKTEALPAMATACVWFRVADPDEVWSVRSLSRRPGGIALLVLVRPEVVERNADPRHVRAVP